MKLILYPDPILRMKAERVTEFGAELWRIIEGMQHVMKKHKGVGLSAPQVGLSLQLVVVKFPPHILINPIVTGRSKDTNTAEEGCLSFPGVFWPIERSNRVTVSFINGPDGDGERAIEFMGHFARVLQHETDHLKGRLFIDCRKART